MDVVRVVDAYCNNCSDVCNHAILADDPSSCFCNVCGTCQTLVSPLGKNTVEQTVDRAERRAAGEKPHGGEIWYSGGSAHAMSHSNEQDRLATISMLCDAFSGVDDVELMRDGLREIAAVSRYQDSTGNANSDPPRAILTPKYSSLNRNIPKRPPIGG